MAPTGRPTAGRGAGRRLSQVAADVRRLLLFFTGHGLFLMTPQTRGSTSGGDTLHCSFWSLNPQGFIYTHDENRMCSTDWRGGVQWGFWQTDELLAFVSFQKLCDSLIYSNFFFPNSSRGYYGVLNRSIDQEALIAPYCQTPPNS